jgi:predicted membrane-bound spermidine synthase
VALPVFFLSGFAALLYQVIWQRLLVIFSGADVYSVTIIVAAFMAGLGFGSLAGGRVADRIGPRASLWGFAIAELCVGCFGLLSKTLYYDVLYTRFPYLAATPAVAAVVLLASLLWPTFFMGLSLPLLARALTHSLGVTGRVIGALYGWNTLGAAAGAFIGTWILLPRFGLEGSLWIAAAMSLACAAAALLLGLRGAVDDGRPAGFPDSTGAPAAGNSEPLSFPGWAFVYGISGFIALAFEITWFRLLGVMLKSNAFTFGTLLGMYLSGLGLGAMLASRRVARSSRPGLAFLLFQCAVVLYAALSTTLLMWSIASGHPIKLVGFLGGYDPVDIQSTIALLRDFALLREVGIADLQRLTPVFDVALLYLVIPALLVGPPTLLMGMSFPYLQKASHADFQGLGRRLGILLASNIAGSALGAMVTGWLFLPRLGTAVTLRLLVGFGALFAVPLARGIWTRQPRTATAALVAAGLIASMAIFGMPDAQTLWARLHGASPAQVLFAEDGSGLSLLKAEGAGFARSRVVVFVNGLGQSWIPYGGVHTALGALPAFIHSFPATVLVIGLGSGDTAFAAAGRTEIQRLVSVEIIGAQHETLQRLTPMQPYPGLLALLSDPRIEHRVGDGRAYILQSERLFDIIEADALRPDSAYSGNLYSLEYFELLRRHLAPGGLAVTWAPTSRIQRTFAAAFPHVLAFHDIFLGSSEPIPFDPKVVEARASAVRSYYEAAGIDITGLLARYLVAPRRIGPADKRAPGDLNTDTFPRDEFALPF